MQGLQALGKSRRTTLCPLLTRGIIHDYLHMQEMWWILQSRAIEVVSGLWRTNSKRLFVNDTLISTANRSN